jgi:hypothetical protein
MIEVSRRKLLTWAGSGLALLSAPKIALPNIITKDRLAEAETQICMNIKACGISMDTVLTPFVDDIYELNKRIVRHIPHLFIDKTMTAPANIIQDKVVLARVKYLQWRCSLEVLQDIKSLVGHDELLHLISYEIATELDSLGPELYPYVPAIPIRYVSVKGYYPFFGFQSHYGRVLNNVN